MYVPISHRVARAAHVILSRGTSVSELTIDIRGATSDLDINEGHTRSTCGGEITDNILEYTINILESLLTNILSMYVYIIY